MAVADRAMITDVEVYFAKGCGRCERFATPDCSTRRWIDGLNHLRRLCTEAGLTETAKWGHPCYMHAGRNLVLLGAFRGDFRINFIEAALLDDPAGVLEKQGPNTAHPNMIRFTDVGQVGAREAVIAAFLRQTKAAAEAGTPVPRGATDIELPDELVEVLDIDPELAEAFHALTPGRQRSYVIALSTAKQAATRLARIEKLRPKILMGKGANEY
jgi:uncharacterized protein YdeI (YjbR/CyaY-like superfamily)